MLNYGILLKPNASNKSSVSGGTVTHLLQSDWFAAGNQIRSIAHQFSSFEVREMSHLNDVKQRRTDINGSCLAWMILHARR
jgi:hypothetical protein